MVWFLFGCLVKLGLVWFGLFVVVVIFVLLDRIRFGLVWFGSVCFCNMGVLFDRTGFGLV